MKLILGLGNPGKQYAGNRHNIGFMAVDAIARQHNFAPFRARFQGRVSEGSIAGERIVLIEPETFMNESGRAVLEAARFYKIGLAEITVLHDELDLAFLRLRVKTGGSNAGHNGLRSISTHLGNDYRRVRLGIGHPGDRNLVHGFVLSDFAKSERPGVETLCDIVARNADQLAKGNAVEFQNKVHLAMTAAGFGEAE